MLHDTAEATDMSEGATGIRICQFAHEIPIRETAPVCWVPLTYTLGFTFHTDFRPVLSCHNKDLRLGIGWAPLPALSFSLQTGHLWKGLLFDITAKYMPDQLHDRHD